MTADLRQRSDGAGRDIDNALGAFLLRWPISG
jgi:hypothetical protein